MALLKDYAQTDKVLFDHLNSPRLKNATHLTQNEIISIIGFDFVLGKIIGEVEKAKYFSVLADEVCSHNVEHLALCLRYVDENCNIREDFVTFVKLERVRALDIANAIIQTLEGFGLSLSKLRGQGYDGASTMSGERAGVQKIIRDREPKAIYTHCAGHSLNLAIVSSCSVAPIRNCIDQIKSFTLWIKYSAKRESLLRAVVEKEAQSGTNRASLLNVCVTRWVENIDGWERFSLCHPFLVKMCEVIVYGDEDDRFPMFNEGWTVEDRRNALAHLKILESFEFLYSLVTLYRSLLYVKEAVVKLQGKEQDIIPGVHTIQQCCEELRRERQDIDNYCKRIFQHSSRLAEQSGISISMPRISQRQQHRSNIHTTSVEEYFKVAIAIPFLDQLISDISLRFSNLSKQACTLQALLPRKITNTTSMSDIQAAVEYYTEDLPNALIMDEELHRWKLRWLAIPVKDRPMTLSESLKLCSFDTLPNIFTLLKIFATIPLSSCSCERSGSTLRRLNTYLRCTQTQDRLSALALIHSHYETDIDIDSICKLYVENILAELSALVCCLLYLKFLSL